MTKIYIIQCFIIITLITSCKAQNNNKKQKPMKTFDIETFNKNKIQNTYNFITKDSTIVEQDEDYNEYTEIIKANNTYFQTINRYYKNGILKSTVQDFPNNFLAGIMKEYDQQGNLIKETNYDEPYKFTFEDIIKFIKKRNIDMNNYYFQITRGVDDNIPYWGIEWEKDDKTGLKHIGINAITGKIVQEIDVEYAQPD